MINITPNRDRKRIDKQEKDNYLLFIAANAFSLFITLAGVTILTGAFFSIALTNINPLTKEEVKLKNTYKSYITRGLVVGSITTFSGVTFLSIFLQNRNKRITNRLTKEENLLEEIHNKVEIYKNNQYPLYQEDEIGLLNTNDVGSSSQPQEEIKVMEDEGLEKYEKILSDLKKKAEQEGLFSEYPDVPAPYETELSKAIRKGKQIAFYIPSEEPEYSEYKQFAISFLRETTDELGIPFDQVQYSFHRKIKRERVYWDGETNEQNQVAIHITPSLCRDIF
ncbi:MAG: hypothetical protein AAF298_02210 [Cyanobacteria bacterium P01_A01_bin.40]